MEKGGFVFLFFFFKKRHLQLDSKFRQPNSVLMNSNVIYDS